MRKYRNIKGNLQPKRILKYSEEWIEYRKKRGADSVKVEHCDVDTDGFHDAIVRDWRSPALKKQQICIFSLPKSGPLCLTAETLPPMGGPTDLTASIVAPSTLTLTPWQDNTRLGGPILGMPTSNKVEFSGTEPVQVTAAQTFIYTQTWGVGGGTPPQFRATFQGWNTDIPGFSGSTNNIIISEGPWVPGRKYSVRPNYTKVQINY